MDRCDIPRWMFTTLLLSLARFLLFCASDDTVADVDNGGLIKAGRPGI